MSVFCSVAADFYLKATAVRWSRERQHGWCSFHEGVLTIKRRLIIGTLIAYTVAVAAQVVTIPTVAIELNTDVQVHTVEAYEEVAYTYGGAEAEVRSYFADIPILAEVARCESTFKHVDPNTGVVTRGRVNPADVGVMQINEYYHKDTATKMGLELTNLEDNMAYARYLYEREGTQPWSASRACWQGNLLAMR